MNPNVVSDTPTVFSHPPAALGEHTEEIIEEFGLSGLAPDRVPALERRV